MLDGEAVNVSRVALRPTVVRADFQGIDIALGVGSGSGVGGSPNDGGNEGRHDVI